MKRISGILKRLARADVAFYMLPPMMALLIAGTIAQKYMGLYEAHQKFFASFYFWAGPVPLPGGYTLIGIFSLALALQFVMGSSWRWSKSGIHLTHFGVLILLFGGLLTALTAQEGYMALDEGASSPYVYDYHRRELMIFSDTGQDDPLHVVTFEDLEQELSGLPFRIGILDKCENCQIRRREEVARNLPQDAALRSMAQFMALEAGPLEKESEVNLNGFTIVVEGAEESSNGVYILFEAMPMPVQITAKSGEIYTLIFGKAQRQLPFRILLQDFVKEDYPGLDKARAYHSDILVQDGNLSWPVRIEMNKPLRYRGYTFYQSSFVEEPDGSEISVLSVVENDGWLYPYIGTLIVLAGLLLHLGVSRRCA